MKIFAQLKKKRLKKTKVKKVKEVVLKKTSLKTTILMFFLTIFLVMQMILSVVTFMGMNKVSSVLVNSYHDRELTTIRQIIKDSTIMVMTSVLQIYEEYRTESIRLHSDNYETDSLEKEYQEKILSLLREYRFSGTNGYFFVYDFNGINLAHPITPELEGENLWEMEDVNGVMVIQELIDAGRDGGGFVDYVWNKPEINKEVGKVGYAIAFEPWKWMIGTGLYVDDIENDIIMFKKEGGKGQRLMLLVYFVTTLVFVIIAILITFLFLTKRVTDPLNELIDKANIITDGDLTVNFQTDYANELGDLINSFKLMVTTLKDLNQKIYVAVSILTQKLRDLYKSSDKVKDSANMQAVTVEETQGNFESLNQMVEIISSESGKADGYATDALEKAKVGMISMGKLEQEMNKIEASSLEITDIIEMINEIAEQTNLLSLNASIESARAGEAGKGFSIVAGEIRKLAEKSTQAAERIHGLINHNNMIIKEGVKYSKETTDILKEIATSNELITTLVKSISQEIHKVKFSSEEILQAIDHISDIAQDNLMESESVTETMKDFVEQTLELQRFVGQFDVRDEEAKSKHKHIEELLRAKLSEASTIINEFGGRIIPTGNTVSINDLKLNELQIGKTAITNNMSLVDTISRHTNSSVTFFQPYDDMLVRVATTVRNFDDSRAIGTTIPASSPVYKSVMERGITYIGRAFVVNRWYVAVYQPIKDETGFVTGVLYLGLPESLADEEGFGEQVGIIKN